MPVTVVQLHASTTLFTHWVANTNYWMHDFSMRPACTPEVLTYLVKKAFLLLLLLVHLHSITHIRMVSQFMNFLSLVSTSSHTSNNPSDFLPSTFTQNILMLQCVHSYFRSKISVQWWYLRQSVITPVHRSHTTSELDYFLWVNQWKQCGPSDLTLQSQNNNEVYKIENYHKQPLYH